MRIIAGAWRGRPLAAPTGQTTRPTSDRAREGLFSMLVSRLSTFEGLRVADLFAGTGALGLEALSRGASHCLFIDSDPKAVAAITHNLGRLGAKERGEVRAQRAERAAAPAEPCDLILIDPPYKGGFAADVLARLCQPGWLAPGAIVSIETGDAELVIPAELERETVRRFGRAHIHLLRRLSKVVPDPSVP